MSAASPQGSPAGAERIAVVLFNLGGPDAPESVQPFLFNLFNDPAIIGAPAPLRWLLARLISRRRAPVARAIYDRIGGSSPLLEQTRAQAAALASACDDLGEVRVFVCMRYWHPMSDEVAAEVRQFAPDRVVLLPLYPQFSTATSESSLQDWRRAARRAGLSAPVHAVCCYPLNAGLVQASTDLIAAALGEAAPGVTPRVLFSAHGLPKKIVERGDPYQWQVEQTAQALVATLEAAAVRPFDWVVCYQSRVGPLAWIEPSTEAEIDRAGADGVPVVVVPVAFVSEHSETLVELDIEYRERAEERGVPQYLRVPTVTTHASFVAGLLGLVRMALSQPPGSLVGGQGGRLCPPAWRRCVCGAA